MPLYEYVCEACGERFESLVLSGSHASVVCTSCGSGDVRRVLSVFAVGRAEVKQDAEPCGPSCCRLRPPAEA